MTPDLDELAERMDSLEDELEAERSERRRLEDELEEKDERISDLEELLEDRTPEDEESSNFTDVLLADVPVGKVVNETRKRVDALESEQAQREPAEAEESDPTAPPIWDLVRTPESNLKPTERRARFLWKDVNDYAHSAPVGLVLPASDARRVLNAAEPDDSDADRITSKQVGRAFHLLLTLTRGAARIREQGGERQLVVPRDWEDRARAAAPDTAVS